MYGVSICRDSTYGYPYARSLGCRGLRAQPQRCRAGSWRGDMICRQRVLLKSVLPFINDWIASHERSISLLYWSNLLLCWNIESGRWASQIPCNGPLVGFLFSIPCDTPYGMPQGIPYGAPFGIPYGEQYGKPYGLPYGVLYGMPYGIPYRTQYAVPYAIPLYRKVYHVSYWMLNHMEYHMVFHMVYHIIYYVV